MELKARYQPIRLLGRGGMGAVWEAMDTGLGHTVAIKMILGETDQVALARLEREAKGLHSIRHPNVVRIYDYQLSEPPYIAMEVLEGCRLDRVPAGTPILPLFRQLAHGIAACHAQGLVHRDIKPANVMVVGGDRAVLVDFGLMKGDEDSKLTREGAILGTLAFLSPEGIRGKKLFEPGDWYSFGASLYRVVEGRLPFDARQVFGYAKGKTWPQPKFRRAPPLSALRRLIVGLLVEDPKERWTDPEAILATLSECAEEDTEGVLTALPPPEPKENEAAKAPEKAPRKPAAKPAVPPQAPAPSAKPPRNPAPDPEPEPVRLPEPSPAPPRAAAEPDPAWPPRRKVFTEAIPVALPDPELIREAPAKLAPAKVPEPSPPVPLPPAPISLASPKPAKDTVAAKLPSSVFEIPSEAELEAKPVASSPEVDETAGPDHSAGVTAMIQQLVLDDSAIAPKAEKKPEAPKLRIDDGPDPGSLPTIAANADGTPVLCDACRKRLPLADEWDCPLCETRTHRHCQEVALGCPRRNCAAHHKILRSLTEADRDLFSLELGMYGEGREKKLSALRQISPRMWQRAVLSLGLAGTLALVLSGTSFLWVLLVAIFFASLAVLAPKASALVQEPLDELQRRWLPEVHEARTLLKRVEYFAGMRRREDDSFRLRVELHLLEDEYDKAQGFARKWVLAEPQDAQMRFYLAYALREIGRGSEAQRHIDSMPPNSAPEVWVERLKSLAQTLES